MGYGRITLKMKQNHYPPKIRVKNWKLIISNDFVNQYINYKNNHSISIKYLKHVRLKDGYYDKWCVTFFYDDNDGFSVTKNNYFDYKYQAKDNATKWMKKHKQ